MTKPLFYSTGAKFKMTVMAGDRERRLSEYRIKTENTFVTIKGSIIKIIDGTSVSASLGSIVKSMILGSPMIKALAKEAFESIDEFKGMKLYSTDVEDDDDEDEYDCDNRASVLYNVFWRCSATYSLRLLPEKNTEYTEIDINVFEIHPCNVVKIRFNAFLFMLANAYEKLEHNGAFSIKPKN